jgi:drug/metabolite transporter (DMT)-like permease
MAILWGSTFFSIKALVTRLAVADFLAVRFLISTLVLLAVFHRQLRMRRRTAAHGIVLGLIWAGAQLVQTTGLEQTSASISGFLTGLYVVFTPLLSFAINRARPNRWVWLAVVLAAIGLAALTIRPGSHGLGFGEWLTIACALLFALHIICLGRWTSPHEAASLTLVQAITMTVVFFAFAIPGGISLPASAVDWLWMIYLAVFCGALTLLLQTWAQAHVEPSKAAVIMCSEPLWATFFAIAFGGEHPTLAFAGGALAILAAMFLVIRPPIGAPHVRSGPALSPVPPPGSTGRSETRQLSSDDLPNTPEKTAVWATTLLDSPAER